MREESSDPPELKLSTPAKTVLNDLIAWYSKNRRFFRLFDDPYDYARELGLTTDELTEAVTELYQRRIVYEKYPCMDTHRKFKFSLYKEYAQSLPASTTTVFNKPQEDTFHVQSHVHVTTTEGVRRGAGAPCGHARGTPAPPASPPPVSWIQGVVFHSPARVHGFRLYGLGRLDEASTNHLRNICNVKGSDDQHWTLHLTYGKVSVSKYGSLKLYPDIGRYGQDAIGLVSEEILGLLKRRDLRVDYELEGEFAYRVSGSRLEELKRGRCRLTWKNYSVEVYFDESVGKTLEGEHLVRIEEKGDPQASKELSMSLADPFFLACKFDEIKDQFKNKEVRSITGRLTHLKKIQHLWVKYPRNGYRYMGLSQESRLLERDYWSKDPAQVQREITGLQEKLRTYAGVMHSGKEAAPVPNTSTWSTTI